MTLIVSYREAEGKEIACERVGDENWGGLGGWIKTCDMKSTTSIDASGATFSAASSGYVNGISFTGNKKIHFLPIRVADKYPNILKYSAGSCSLTSVARHHFKGLSKLDSLSLDNNQIEIIESDTFVDLVDLERLVLRRKNKILFINSP
jgi:hypothetical protein